MVAVDRLFRQGFSEIPFTSEGKDYSMRLYLQEEVQGFCHATIYKESFPSDFLSFMDSLLVREKYEVYHVLLLEESTYHPLYTRLYSIRVEVAEPEFRHELDQKVAAAVRSFKSRG